MKELNETQLALAVAPAIEDRQIALTTVGEDMIANALEGSALICKCADEIDNKLIVDSQIGLKNAVNALEKCRVELNKPALEFQRRVNDFFKQKQIDLKNELLRISVLADDYATIQMAKARAEQNARNEELTRLEREREAALAKADTHEERETIQEHYNERAAIEAAPPASPVVAPKGQKVETELEVVVNDIWALARAHPTCVNVSPRLTDIKALIRNGIRVAGCTWREVVKAKVRATPGRTIEV